MEGCIPTFAYKETHLTGILMDMWIKRQTNPSAMKQDRQNDFVSAKVQEIMSCILWWNVLRI